LLLGPLWWYHRYRDHHLGHPEASEQQTVELKENIMGNKDLTRKDIVMGFITSLALIGIIGGLFLLTLSKIEDGSFNHIQGLFWTTVSGGLLLIPLYQFIKCCYKLLFD